MRKSRVLLLPALGAVFWCACRPSALALAVAAFLSAACCAAYIAADGLVTGRGRRGRGPR